MIANRDTLLQLAPIKDMVDHKQSNHGVTHGLGEAGYDIRLKQTIRFLPNGYLPGKEEACVAVKWWENGQQFGRIDDGRFVLASAIEEFDMPNNLVGIVHDKSSLARRGLSVFNTVIEPGWKGFLTLELVYHGNKELILPAGMGIAQVVFHLTSDAAEYSGRYQHQPDQPVEAIHAG